MTKTLMLWLLVPLAMLSAQCAPVAPPPPANLAEYEKVRMGNPTGYPRRTILTYNLQRVLDGERTTDQRVASLQLVLHLGAEDESVRRRLSSILTAPESPYELHHTVLSFLLEKDYPGLAGYVIPALARADQDPRLRDAILQWLSRHPSPVVLGEVVKLWARQPSTTTPGEPRFRLIAERITGLTWEQALLSGINSRGAFPRGEALEILSRRARADSLKKRILRMEPNTAAVAGLQSFLDNFDYLPTTQTEFEAVESIFKTRLEMIADAARIDGKWRRDYGYRFNVRDFHLMSRMGRDPLRTMLRRTQLILELGQSLATRQHVRYGAHPGTGRSVVTDRFGLQVETLSVSDMWNLYLLNEMLTRPRMQLALKIMADNNRADPGSSRGGLVFYQHGQGEAMLYPPDEVDEGLQLVSDGRDSLCLFIAHFEKVYNTSQAGPTADELRRAREGNYYGLILTSVNEYAFCAHYYNPSGQVVSLGKFAFRQ